MSDKFLFPMAKIKNWQDIDNPMSFTYDDVNLVPQMSSINSRKEIDISCQFGPFELKVPIISAPMDTVTGEEMVLKLHEMGALGCLPRENNGDFEINLKLCEKFSKKNVNCLYSVSLNNSLEKAKKLKKLGAKAILIDVAHGGMYNVVKVAKEIKKLGLFVVAGNIASFNQAEVYKNEGIDVARVGVGPGGLCITRLVAGTGVGQLAAVLDTVSAGIPVIADGGIKKSADMVKALAAGASFVMIGSAFAGTVEAPGKVINGKKEARGQASESYMKANGIEGKTAEGISKMIKVKGSVEKIINEYVGGLKSAMSYTGARNLKEFRQKAIFVMASSSVQNENKPHIEG